MNRPLFAYLALTLVFTACSKREFPSQKDEQQRADELERFIEAVHLVQERYVDVDQVQLEQIISNSLKGVVAAVDPYAEIYYTGESISEEIPEDVPMIESEGPDKNGILILRVFGFNNRLKKHLKKLKTSLRDQHISSILLDCRGSYGNNFEAAAMLADWFLPRDATIGTLEKLQGARVQTFVSKKKPLWATNMVVVVQDNTLKGPGEFLAAALRANERCILVGQPSRGAAVVQTPIQLTDEWTVLLTTGRAREPGGHLIYGSPIIPDIIAQPEPENDENFDWTYQRGLAVLKDQAVFKDGNE